VRGLSPSQPVVLDLEEEAIDCVVEAVSATETTIAPVVAADAAYIPSLGRAAALVFGSGAGRARVDGAVHRGGEGRLRFVAGAGGDLPARRQTARTGVELDVVVVAAGGDSRRLMTSDVNGPHQGAIVDTPHGDWWFLHFQERQPYGRIVHLQPMRWKDGWPFIGEDRDNNGIGEPVSTHAKPVTLDSSVQVPATSDEFSHSHLGLQWQWHANAQENWHSLTARPGWLRLYAQPAPSDDLYLLPNALLQKLPAEAFVVETSLEVTNGAEAGFGVIGNESAAITIRRVGTDTEIRLVIAGKMASTAVLQAKSVTLRVAMHPGGLCQFAYSDGGHWVTLPESFQAIEGKWIGAKIGIYCSTLESVEPVGHADFDYFRVLPPSQRQSC